MLMSLSFKTKAQLAAEYGLCRKTMRKKMRAMPYDFPRTSLSPSFVKAVYESIGHYPSGVNEEEWRGVRLPPERIDEAAEFLSPPALGESAASNLSQDGDELAG